MRIGPPTFPLLPEDLERLTPDERAWCERIRPWYIRATACLSARAALKHPMTEEFERDRSHWPYFVRFYLTSPIAFDMILCHVTGSSVRGATLRQRQKAWSAKIARKGAMTARHAAE